MKKKLKYEKPKLTKVVLNPAQAVLAICSTTSSTARSGSINTCKSGSCKKSMPNGDSVGHS